MEATNTPHAQAVLEVLQLPGVGVAKGRELARQATARMVDPRELAHAKGKFSRVDVEAAASEAERILSECSRLAIRVLAIGDSSYPSRLAEISDAPPVIYVKGSPEALVLPAVAVVGTRDASEGGLRAAGLIGSYVASRKMVVVSGLALGIDAAAHNGALAAGGVTVAVLAHGLDTLSPKTNLPIAECLLASGGALVSEHPPGVPARPAEFVRRNRIQSGMSICSVVVESGEKGGAMHQAAFTVSQHRKLITVLSRDSGARLNEAGARRLVSEFGATAVHGTAELGRCLDELLASTAPVRPTGQRELDW